MTFLYPASSDEIAFFEIAATLIPILLFGGVLVDRSRPPTDGKWSPPHVCLALALPLFGSLALLAEVIAIRAIMAGDAALFARVFVAGVLIAGMAAVVLTVSLPWVIGLQERSSDSLSRSAVASVAVVGLIAGAAFTLLVDGLASADRGEREEQGYRQALKSVGELEAMRHRIDSVSREFEGLRQRREVARAKGDSLLYRSFAGQVRSLNDLLRLYRREERRLMLESWNLLREGAGKPPLRRLGQRGAS